jgi:hypothetical protein
MLLIALEQIRRFEHVMLEGFERRLLAHIEEHFPTHWRVVGAAQMGQVVRFGISRARSAGLQTERDGYLFHSLMLSLGSHFDTDPQYPWLAGALGNDAVGSRSERLVNAHDAAVAYLVKVAGPQGQQMTAALRRLRSTVIPELRHAAQVNFDYLLSVLRMIWPQKVEHLGEQAVRSLAHAVMPVARKGGLTSSAGACLYVIACFMFGHGLHRDPQFPWVAQALSRDLSKDRAAKGFEESFAAHLAALE